VSGRPIIQCEEKDAHPPHFYLHQPHSGPPLYASCDGVLPQSTPDPHPTRVDIPIYEPARRMVMPGERIDQDPWQDLGYVASDGVTTPARREISDLDYILNVLLPEIRKKMIADAAHYGTEGHKGLGLKGQFADMYRKMVPLKRQMWDGIPSTREDTREIVQDMIGHCLLTLALLDELTAQAEETD
jgi:hypothetical protein